jgi:predicted RNase H-like nuclease
MRLPPRRRQEHTACKGSRNSTRKKEAAMVAAVTGARAAGADGCRAGWICIVRERAGGLGSAAYATADALFAQIPRSAVLAIDIPIGLAERGARECDGAARRLLGSRRSSVFPAPLRCVLAARSFEQACRIRARREDKRMSRQAFGIVAKVREVDAALRADVARARTVREVHPELCFAAWSGAPLAHSKKTPAGRAERLALVAGSFGSSAFAAVRSRHPRRDAADDDILDAFAALWSAERLLRGEAEWLPAEPPLDACGLRMEIVY